ncbi:hypothetical protein LTR95_019590, partial [Oleoguttula sp. CCFEE 5521]
MPYTPPTQQSPASSKSNIPTVSRSSSYSEDVPRSPAQTRPQLPRSHSSASDMSRHRRTPSMTSSQGPPTPTAEVPDNGVEATDFTQKSSTRQSPPPVNHVLIPTGAVISPPDSSEDSDGDDNKTRGRQMELRELQDAVRSIDQKKSGSPERTQDRTTSASEAVSTLPTALSAEARKISHPRSSTETAIIMPRTTSFAESPVQVTDDSDEDDNEDGVPSKP